MSTLEVSYQYEYCTSPERFIAEKWSTSEGYTIILKRGEKGKTNLAIMDVAGETTKDSWSVHNDEVRISIEFTDKVNSSRDTEINDYFITAPLMSDKGHDEELIFYGYFSA